ncbi:hypothetical protein ACFRAR_30825 [Kitasatospora sp. NPDC056651]|uniref:hypothetical protein n=1 Tax=Kitasatospora sp. NPDC056651 TaxID=3345892 RepID=UPI00367630C9
MNASVIARIAKIVPLAVVAAVGVAACGPTNGGASVAASVPVATPAATSSATPGAGAVPAPTTPAATTPAPTVPATAEAPTDAQAPTVVTAEAGAQTTARTAVKDAAKPAPAKPTTPSGGGGIKIGFSGLDVNGRINRGELVPFSVTWKNNDTTGTRAVAPVVSTQPYEGAPCPLVFGAAEGTLERKDASGWKTLDHLSQGTGMDYAGTGDDAAFTLAAGESRTIEYRVRLSTVNRPGALVIEADAPVPNSKNHLDMAKAVWHGAVVDPDGPWVSRVSTTDLRTGTTPAEFGFTVTAPKGTAELRPEVVVSSPYGVNEGDVVLEAKTGGAWTPVALHDDCGGLTAIAPAGLEVDRSGDSAEYAFRITMTKPSQHGVKVQVGARANDHRSTLQNLSSDR